MLGTISVPGHPANLGKRQGLAVLLIGGGRHCLELFYSNSTFFFSLFLSDS